MIGGRSACGRCATAARVRAGRLARGGTARLSPPQAPLLPQRWELERAEELHLVLELDAELLARAAPSLDHQRDGVHRARSVRVLDEVRVTRRDLRAADSVPLQAAGLEHPPRCQLVLGVAEDAAEGALVRRLRGLPQRLQPRDVRLDLLLRQRTERELGAGDHLAVAQLRVAVAEAELGGREPARALLVDDERAIEDRGPVTAVRAGVHPDAAADRAGDGAGELESPERGRSHAMQADRVGGAAAGDQALLLDADVRKLASQLQDETVEALVR